MSGITQLGSLLNRADFEMGRGGVASSECIIVADKRPPGVPT